MRCMKVIIGLGNPGPTYAATRHNIGWMVLDRLARQRHARIAARLTYRLRVVAAYGAYR